MLVLDKSDHAHAELSLSLEFAVQDVWSYAATVLDHNNVINLASKSFLMKTNKVTSITSSL
jgi:hypothetical protein